MTSSTHSPDASHPNHRSQRRPGQDSAQLLKMARAEGDAVLRSWDRS